MTSPSVRGTRPVSSASSCTLGFTRSGLADRLSASGCTGGVDGDGTFALAAGRVRPPRRTSPRARRRAGFLRTPARWRREVGGDSDEQALAFLGLSRARLVDLGDGAVGLGEADVAADFAGDRHDDGVQACGVEHLSQLRADGTARGHDRAHRHAVRVQREGDVDALAAGFAPAALAAVDRPEHDVVEEHGAVHTRVGCEGEDHVRSTSIPAVRNWAYWSSVRPASLIRTSMSSRSPCLVPLTTPNLLWSAKQDPLGRAAEHQPFDGRLGGVGGGQPARHRDAVGAEEGDVDVDLGQRTHGPVADLGERLVAHPPAKGEDRQPRPGQQRHRQRHGVGVDGQVAVAGEQLDQLAVVDPASMSTDPSRADGERGLGDAGLLRRELRFASPRPVRMPAIGPAPHRRAPGAADPWRSSAMRSLRIVSPVTPRDSAISIASTRPLLSSRSRMWFLRWSAYGVRASTLSVMTPPPGSRRRVGGRGLAQPAARHRGHRPR